MLSAYNSVSSVIRYAAFRLVDSARGRPIAKHIEHIEARMGRDFSHSCADEELDDFLAFATRTTPFFERFAGQPLDRFPVLSKRTLKESQSKHLSTAFRIGDLVAATTSGSTGNPTTFYLTVGKKARQHAEVLYFGRWGDFWPGVEHAYVRVTKSKSPFKLWVQNETLMDPTSLSEGWLERQREVLRRGEIRVIIGYVSAIRALAEWCLTRGDRPSDFRIRSVFTSSEPLPDEARRTIKAAFGCSVMSRYSTEEFGVLAQECPEVGTHHLNTASYRFEILSTETDRPVPHGDRGRLVVTDLYSHAMPLIRYETGDLAAFGAECPCGRPGPTLSNIEGRQVEQIFAADNTPVSPFSINGALRDVAGVLQFQFIQTARKHYTLLLHLHNASQFSAEELVLTRLRQILGAGTVVEIRRVDDIPPLPSGKRPYIRSELA